MDTRIATVDDAPTVTGIINRAFVVEAFFKIGERTSREDVVGLMRDGGEFLLAEEDGRAAGCVFVKANGDVGYSECSPSNPDGRGGDWAVS